MRYVKRPVRQEKAEELKGICEQIKADFNKYLVKDGVVAGYGLVESDRGISVTASSN